MPKTKKTKKTGSGGGTAGGAAGGGAAPYPVPKLPASLLAAADTELPPVRDKDVTHDYQIFEKIGEGSFAVVTRIMKHGTDEVFALKVIEAATISRSTKQRIDVIREVTLLKDFKHENIVNLVEAFRTNTQDVGLIMDYCTGDLCKHMKANSKILKAAHIKFAWKELTKGMAFLHSNNIMHRDFKPQNVLISTTGLVKIADFGLARKIDALPDKHTRNLTVCGTRVYMAPEAFFHKYDFKVDIWSLGCVGFYLHTGKHLVRMRPPRGTIGALEGIQHVCGDIFGTGLKLSSGNYRILKRLCQQKFLINDDATRLLDMMLEIVSHRRPEAAELLRDSYYTESTPLPSSLYEDPPEDKDPPEEEEEKVFDDKGRDEDEVVAVPETSGAVAADPMKVITYESEFVMVDDPL